MFVFNAFLMLIGFLFFIYGLTEYQHGKGITSFFTRTTFVGICMFLCGLLSELIIYADNV